MQSAPPSWCPSQRETVGICTPDSMQRVANRWRKSWWVIRFAPVNFAALSMDFWHSKTRMMGLSGASSGRVVRSASSRRRKF